MKLNKDELYKAMRVHNYNLAELHKVMGISRSTLYTVLKGKREPGNKVYNGVKRAFTDEETKNILEI